MLTSFLLIGIALVFGMTIPTSAAPAAAAAFFAARAFGRPVARLALLHRSQWLLGILPRGPICVLRSILRLALTRRLIAVASLVAAAVSLRTRTASRLVALAGIAPMLWTCRSMIAPVLRIAATARIARPRFHGFGFGLRLARQPAYDLVQN